MIFDNEIESVVTVDEKFVEFDKLVVDEKTYEKSLGDKHEVIERKRKDK